MSLLQSYSYYAKEMDVSLASDILDILNKTTATYGYYIQGYECKSAEERKQVIDAIKQNTLMHVLRKYTPSKGSLRNYVNAIQKNILRKPVKTINIDTFLEIIDSRFEGGDDVVDLQDSNQSSSNIAHKKSFEEDVLSELCDAEDLFLEVEKLALSDPLPFIYLCDALLSKNTSTKNKYQKEFMIRVLNLSRRFKKFNDCVEQFYIDYGDSIIEFMAMEERFTGCWKTFSKEVLDKSESKRLKLVRKNTINDSVDPDLEPFVIKGNSVVGGKEQRQILKVNYSNLLEYVDGLFRAKHSPLRLCFENNYLLRTLAGEYSEITPNIARWTELQKAEIITNILFNLDAKLLGIGTDNLYLLSKPHYKVQVLKFERYSIPITIVPEVITNEVRFTQ